MNKTPPTGPVGDPGPVPPPYRPLPSQPETGAGSDPGRRGGPHRPGDVASSI